MILSRVAPYNVHAAIAMHCRRLIAPPAGPSDRSLIGTARRYVLTIQETALVATWEAGSAVKPVDGGWKRMKRGVRDELAHRGLSYCCILKRVFHASDMRRKYVSFEGRQRYDLWHGARRRAELRHLPFDSSFMKIVAFGSLPTHFAGVAYEPPRGQRQGTSKMSLTVDRIVGAKGYVQGNVRFLPF